MSTTLPKIEEAFAQHFANKTIRTLEGKVVNVPVFIDYPDSEELRSQKYPSISINLFRLEPAVETYETKPDTLVRIDDSVDPPVFVTRRPPEKYMITYEVCAYSLSAYEDRELLRWIEGRFAPRSHIEVDGETYHVFRMSFDSNDMVDVDTVIYEKTWTFDILADIEDLDNDQEARGINKITLTSNVVRTTAKVVEPTTRQPAKMLYNAPKSADTAADAEKVLHRVLHFNDQDYWFDPNK